MSCHCRCDRPTGLWIPGTDRSASDRSRAIMAGFKQHQATAYNVHETPLPCRRDREGLGLQIYGRKARRSGHAPTLQACANGIHLASVSRDHSGRSIVLSPLQHRWCSYCCNVVHTGSAWSGLAAHIRPQARLISPLSLHNAHTHHHRRHGRHLQHGDKSGRS